MELEGVSARLSTEIFFFRKKLFAELFIHKMDSKIFRHENIDKEIINNQNKTIYNNWKTSLLKELAQVQKYLKSPFTFEDTEQFSNYKSIDKFTPNRELQQDLISETYYWIENFSNAKERFQRAVELYNSDEDKRDCLDNLRLSLELVLKGVLQNDKSMENQKGLLGVYQKEQGIGTEFRNMFLTTLDYFSKYQNKNVKHDNKVDNEHEVEFVFGLVMIFIRMLIKPNSELNK